MTGGRLSRLSLPAALIVGLVFGVGQAVGSVPRPTDAWIYWSASLDHLYSGAWVDYVYPPPLAQFLALAHVLPWEVFVVGWTTLLFGCLWYAARWLTLPLIGAGLLYVAVPGLPQVFGVTLSEVMLGNVTILIVACCVAGIRHPGAWAVPALTKVAPWIGLLWHATDFAALSRAVYVIGGVVAVSSLLAPGLWVDWFRFASSTPIEASPLPTLGFWQVRLVLGIALVLLARRRGWPWLVPFACGLALPPLYGWPHLVSYAIGGVALVPVEPVEVARHVARHDAEVGRREARRLRALPLLPTRRFAARERSDGRELRGVVRPRLHQPQLHGDPGDR